MLPAAVARKFQQRVETPGSKQDRRTLRIFESGRDNLIGSAAPGVNQVANVLCADCGLIGEHDYDSISDMPDAAYRSGERCPETFGITIIDGDETRRRPKILRY